VQLVIVGVGVGPKLGRAGVKVDCAHKLSSLVGRIPKKIVHEVESATQPVISERSGEIPKTTLYLEGGGQKSYSV
jgi:hypothetical protein